jgi:hypothetical protein
MASDRGFTAVPADRRERVPAAVVMPFAMRRIIVWLVALAALLVGCLLLIEVVWLAGERV